MATGCSQNQRSFGSSAPNFGPELAPECLGVVLGNATHSSGLYSHLFVQHEGGSRAMEISFKRTIRMPYDRASHALPPDLGNFPFGNVKDFEDTLPGDMSAKVGCFTPIYKGEAMSIRFKSTRPFAVKVLVGGINAISGEAMAKTHKTGIRRRNLLNKKKWIQDYAVISPAERGQQWLDGFVSSDGKIMQFTAVDTASGYYVEAQIAGTDSVGGLQVMVTPLKPGRFLDVTIKTLSHGCYMIKNVNENSTVVELMQTIEMTMAFLPKTLFFYTMESASKESLAPPEPPISAETYVSNDLPLFNIPDEFPTGISGNFGDVKSIQQINFERSSISSTHHSEQLQHWEKPHAFSNLDIQDCTESLMEKARRIMRIPKFSKHKKPADEHIKTMQSNAILNAGITPNQQAILYDFDFTATEKMGLEEKQHDFETLSTEEFQLAPYPEQAPLQGEFPPASGKYYDPTQFSKAHSESEAREWQSQLIYAPETPIDEQQQSEPVTYHLSSRPTDWWNEKSEWVEDGPILDFQNLFPSYRALRAYLDRKREEKESSFKIIATEDTANFEVIREEDVAGDEDMTAGTILPADTSWGEISLVDQKPDVDMADGRVRRYPCSEDDSLSEAEADIETAQEEWTMTPDIIGGNQGERGVDLDLINPLRSGSGWLW